MNHSVKTVLLLPALTALHMACLLPTLSAVARPSRAEVAAGMKRSATFYRTQVARHGGYVYYSSVDLQRRFGEGVASSDQIWVQPPGTPTVGMAYLKAYDATGDEFYLDAATETAEALVYGQLESGGWTNCIDFDPQGDRVALYRNGKGRGRNNSSLDDDQTQSALRFLLRIDRARNFEHETIHQSATIALDALLAAQFANGAFPQVWDAPVESDRPVIPASLPPYDWRTERRIRNYWDMYTLNDNLAGSVSQTLIEAHEISGSQRSADALRRLGDFLILAQLPNPQPGWSQQYSYQMHPIWARRFEPPAVSGSESQDALETLLRIYAHTSDAKYLEPVPRAIAYFRQSLLDDGRLARYYELETNRPLYMRRSGDVYLLTYDDSDLPDHYAFKVRSRLDAIGRRYGALARRESGPASGPSADELALRARKILSELDSQGRWLATSSGQRLAGDVGFRPGEKYLSSALFSANLETLSEYLGRLDGTL